MIFSRHRLLAALFVATLGSATFAGCASDGDDAAPGVVVPGAPLSVIGPTLTSTTEGSADVIIGTLSNVTERTVEVVEVSASVGEVGFRSADGSTVESVVIEPDERLQLTADGLHLALTGVDELEAVDVTLALDIEDDFTFRAARSTGQVETQPVEVEGAPLPELGDTDDAVGSAAPRVSGLSFDGSEVDLLIEGQPSVVGFFAHWCPHCQREVIELSEYLAESGTPDDVRIVAVSTAVDSQEENFPPSTWFATAGWPTDVLADDPDNSAARAFGLPAFPYWVVVDADGAVVERIAGAIGPSQLERLVESARTGSAG